jgi:uncharacterized protein YndB with AHSA1/START domain
MPASAIVTTPSDREIRVERKFAAPPELVFEYHTKCEHVQKWLLGPPGWSMPKCAIDLRPGGRYEYVWRSDEDGNEFGVHGEFREIDAPKRIVNVERMDGAPGQAVVMAMFSNDGTGTAFSVTIEFESKTQRDGALETGMTDGMATSYERLENFLTSH